MSILQAHRPRLETPESHGYPTRHYDLVKE
ncbi:MAG: hypothetical protein QOF53_3755, partial [Nocardioidaceae bacterium]|nr:hypothetical protein [Nocardioidaceae bacterium]